MGRGNGNFLSFKLWVRVPGQASLKSSRRQPLPNSCKTRFPNLLKGQNRINSLMESLRGWNAVRRKTLSSRWWLFIQSLLQTFSDLMKRSCFSTKDWEARESDLGVSKSFSTYHMEMTPDSSCDLIKKMASCFICKITQNFSLVPLGLPEQSMMQNYS